MSSFFSFLSPSHHFHLICIWVSCKFAFVLNVVVHDNIKNVTDEKKFVDDLIIQLQDGIKWHDVVCTHKKPIICEEISELLDFVKDN